MDHETPPASVFIVFFTVTAQNSMTLFDWGRTIEEVTIILIDATMRHDWGYLRGYGPSSEASVFRMAFEAHLTAEALDWVTTEMRESAWIDVFVNVTVGLRTEALSRMPTAAELS